jgi:SAM-dependent methyltransferase
MWTHEESYKGRGIAPFIHRKRLERILGLFDELEIADSGSLADFGCSNGFIISLLRSTVFSDKNYELVGFDHSEELLELARLRVIPNTSFNYIDLNSSADGLDAQWCERFDIVSCFETIEHAGSFANAFHTICKACKIGGVILLSMPNEKGCPGLVKYLGRKALQKNPYDDFFDDRSELDYVRHLLLNKQIDEFRFPARDAWGPHLGFDWEVVSGFIKEEYVNPRKLEFLFKRSSFLKLNLFFAFRKIG